MLSWQNTLPHLLDVMPGPWIQPGDMTRRCSGSQQELHLAPCTVTAMEPPISDSPVPSLDEAANSLGSHSRRGNLLGKTTCHHLLFLSKHQQNPSRVWWRNDVSGDATISDGTWRQFIWMCRNECMLGCPIIQWLTPSANERVVGNTVLGFGYNQTENHPGNHQSGVTAVLLLNMLAHWAIALGADPSGLGWWCWAKIVGKNNQVTRIIALYRPCKPNGPMSTYQQHIRALIKLKWNECPKKAVIKDITSAIWQWQEE